MKKAYILAAALCWACGDQDMVVVDSPDGGVELGHTALAYHGLGFDSDPVRPYYFGTTSDLVNAERDKYAAQGSRRRPDVAFSKHLAMK